MLGSEWPGLDISRLYQILSHIVPIKPSHPGIKVLISSQTMLNNPYSTTSFIHVFIHSETMYLMFMIFKGSCETI